MRELTRDARRGRAARGGLLNALTGAGGQQSVAGRHFRRVAAGRRDVYFATTALAIVCGGESLRVLGHRPRLIEVTRAQALPTE